jgi:hypothetical protein
MVMCRIIIPLISSFKDFRQLRNCPVFATLPVEQGVNEWTVLRMKT